MGSLGSKTLADKFGEFGQSDLSIAELGAARGGSHREQPADKALLQARKQELPLAVRKRRRLCHIPEEFDTAVGSVHVLAAWTG